MHNLCTGPCSGRPNLTAQSLRTDESDRAKPLDSVREDQGSREHHLVIFIVIIVIVIFIVIIVIFFVFYVQIGSKR